MSRKIADFRHMANIKINHELKNVWLDDATIREFTAEQTVLQRYPALLKTLIDKIRKEIHSRIEAYSHSSYYDRLRKEG